MSRRSQDNYSPYSPKRVVVSNLNHRTIGVCLGGVPRAYKRGSEHYGYLSLILLLMG